MPVDDDDADTATVRPRQLFKSKPAPAPRLSGIEEDYSDLGIDEDDLETKLSNMKVCFQPKSIQTC